MGASHLGNRWLRSRGSRDGYCVCDLSHRYARRVLTGVAALGLILFASATWRARPRLAITPDGLAIRGWFRTQLLRHSNIKIIRIDEFRRYGRLVRLLEIETVSGGLLILSRWDLGTDPVEVLDALTAAGYAGRGQR